MATVDILLPVRNGLPYVEEAIKSILDQTFNDFKLFVIDDGSTDETAAIARNYARSDSRIRLITPSGNGLIDALNDGLDMATSPLIARMDADDISMPKRLERQVAYLKANPEVIVAGCWIEYIDGEGKSLRKMERYPTSPTDVERQLFSNSNPIAHPTVMMRRDLVRAVGGYRRPLKAAEDYDLWLRLAETGKLANLPEALLRYRLHPDQVSAEQRLAQSFASELAFICSEERRAGRPDPVENSEGAVSWLSPYSADNVGVIKDLCDRFAAMGDIIQTKKCQKDLLHSANSQMAHFRLSMSINHRLYADVAAKIAVQAIHNSAPLIALRAIFIGSCRSTFRFWKMALKYYFYRTSIIQ